MNIIKSLLILVVFLIIGYQPVYAQTSGIEAIPPGLPTTAIRLATFVAMDQVATTPTVTAPTNSAYASIGALKVTTTYVGTLTAGSTGVLTVTLSNPLPPSTSAQTLAMTASATYTDNTGNIQKTPVNATLSLASVAAVNNVYTNISFSIIVPATEFVPSAPVTGANYTVLNNDLYFNPVASLDGGQSVTWTVPGVYE